MNTIWLILIISSCQLIAKPIPEEGIKSPIQPLTTNASVNQTKPAVSTISNTMTQASVASLQTSQTVTSQSEKIISASTGSQKTETKTTTIQTVYINMTLQQVTLRNPFLMQLESFGVVLPEKKKVNDTKCGKEWADFGTFCDIKNLSLYAITDTKSINSSVERTSEGLKMISNLFYDVYNNSKINPTAGLKGELKKFFDLWECKESREFISIIESFRTTDNIHRTLQKCWTKMAQVRASSLCSICSARSTLYFGSKKALVREEDCESILTECSDSFTTILNFVEKSEPFLSILNHIIVSKFQDNSMETPIKRIISFLTELKKSHVQESISKYLKTKKDASDYSKAVGEVCGKLLRVFEEPFITFMSNLMKDPASTVQRDYKMITEYFTMKTTKLVQKSNYASTTSSIVTLSTSSRRLRLLRSLQVVASDLSNSILTGDVMMIPKVDSSYLSYQGALGTTGNEGSKHGGKPLEVNIQFP